MTMKERLRIMREVIKRNLSRDAEFAQKQKNPAKRSRKPQSRR